MMRHGRTPDGGRPELAGRQYQSAANHVRKRMMVLYDGNCSFCRVCAHILTRLDHGDRLDLIDFNRHQAEPLLESLTPGARRRALHVVQPDGLVASAGPALRQALTVVLGSTGSRALDTRAVALAVDTAYSLIAANRRYLGWIERLGRWTGPD